ncbi:zinc ribbon domain-containing protein [Streptomyces sp. NPDC001450]
MGISRGPDRARSQDWGTESRIGAKSLLSGVARCGECGAPVTSLLGAGYTRKAGTKTPGDRYYRCSSKFAGGACAKGLHDRWTSCRHHCGSAHGGQGSRSLPRDSLPPHIGQWSHFPHSSEPLSRH